MLSSLLSKTAATVVSLPLKNVGSKLINNIAKMSTQKSYETVSVSVPQEFVYHVELNRPEKLNALNKALWCEVGECIRNLEYDENCRVIVLSGAGKVFTAGLDFEDAMALAPELAEHEDVARKAKILFKTMKDFQYSLNSLEVCKKPVLSAIHSACIGGGIEIIAASDIRYCTKDAWFQVKEVDFGLAADIGSLQRLPKIIGSDSLVRELCYTARKLHAAEALSCGLVSRVFEDKDSMIKATIDIAREIAKKSPVAVQTTKASLVYSRDHSVQDGLDHIAVLNQLMLQSEDFMNAVMAQATKQKDVTFSKL